MGDPSHQSNVTCREYLVAKIFKGGGGGVGGGVMFSFHVQILINFRYDFGYKPIFTSYESHLFIKGAKNRETVILDPNSHYI